MRMLDLFSGIGGFSLAASWVWDDLEIVAFCEKDKFCQKVLKKHWPDVPIIEDIYEMKGDEFGTIDLLTGGFPCQPFSVAGKQRGAEDDRYLWPEMFRIIKESKSRWIVGENVTGILNMELDNVLSDLEVEAYETQAFIIPACGADAKHRRDRVWIVANVADPRTKDLYKREEPASEVLAYPIGNTKGGTHGQDFGGNKRGRQKQDFGERDEMGGNSTDHSRQWLPEPDVGRMAHGIPNRVDRLKALGNAIVPQVAQRIFWGIKNEMQHYK